MANQPNNGEVPTTVSETIPSPVGSAPTLTVTQTGPILLYVGPRGPLGTPPHKGKSRISTLCSPRIFESLDGSRPTLWHANY